MMRRALAATSLVVAAACMPEAGNAPAARDRRQAPDITAALPAAIIGTYVVTDVNGTPPAINIAGHEPTITIGPERIHFQSQCIYADWTYRRDGEAILTTPYYEPGSGMCARGWAPGETAIEAAIKAAARIREISGGLILEGGGHRLQMRRVIDPVARAIDLAGEWYVTQVDGQSLAGPERIVLRADREKLLWEPSCALQYRRYSIAGARFDTQPVDRAGREVCEIGHPQALPQIWAAMDAAETIARVEQRGVVISGNGRSVTLFPR